MRTAVSDGEILWKVGSLVGSRGYVDEVWGFWCSCMNELSKTSRLVGTLSKASRLREACTGDNIDDEKSGNAREDTRVKVKKSSSV